MQLNQGYLSDPGGRGLKCGGGRQYCSSYYLQRNTKGNRKSCCHKLVSIEGCIQIRRKIKILNGLKRIAQVLFSKS